MWKWNRFIVVKCKIARALSVTLVALLGMLLFGIPVSAAPTATTRFVTANGNDFGNGACSLANPCRSIAHAVNVAVAGDTIDIGSGTFNEFPLVVSKNLTFVGKGVRNTVIDNNHQGSAVTIQNGVNAEIKKLRIKNGDATSPDEGGGVRNLGTLTLQQVTLSDNTAYTGAGIYNQGILVLKKVTLYNNTAGGYGGGLYNASGGSAGLGNVNIQTNRANLGGGIYSGGFLSIAESAVHGTVDGGGIVSNAFLLMLNVTISGNLNPGTAGAGLAVIGGDAYLHYVTITGNAGYGIYIADAGTVSLFNSIVYGNTSNPQCGTNLIGPYSDGGYNVLADQSCSYWPGSGSIIANPKLKPLAYNGGYTPTHALKASSPAIDRVPQKKCTTQDQRGVARPVDGNADGKLRCDAGTFEFEP